MSKISVTKLTKILNDNNLKTITLDQLRSSCEAYGKKVVCYIQFKDSATAKKAKDFLKYDMDLSIDKYGVPEVVAVNVAYFKAWHWNE